ncbi:MAG: isopentenyl phosphate kinase [Candidatus Micrarchaeota archaeon]|nr:isopentenyl phosphate kinase [Candidatus Micrarchaeota archaeon]
MIVAIKLGGSIITQKSKFKTPNLQAIDALCALISEYYKKGVRFIVVHGAGSYAHIPSKEYGLADGIRGDDGQVHFAYVHSLCEELSTLIINSLVGKGVPAISFHPATFVIQKNKLPFKIDDKMLLRYLKEGFVPVTHGDVVLDNSIRTSIISGDALMDYFGKRIAGKLIFVSDVDGLLTSLDGKGELIREVTRDNFKGVYSVVSGSKHVDVTGGMAGKIKNLMSLKCPSYIVSGKHPNRIRSILDGRNDIYTKFIP